MKQRLKLFNKALKEFKQVKKAMDDFINVYTDGSCKNNGRVGARAGYGVYFGPNNPLNVARPVQGNRVTNNAAEIQAATEAAEIAYNNGYNKIRIHTDSEFVQKSVNDWMPKWKDNGWRKASGEPVKNRTDFEKLDSALQKFDKYEIKHVRGHSNNFGNENADRLANLGSHRFRR